MSRKHRSPHERKPEPRNIWRLLGAFLVSVALGLGLTPLASADTRGQDTSRWQGDYNVSILEDFGILKVSGSDIGYNYLDPMYKRKAAQVRASGKNLGFYYYNGYADPVGAANFFVDNLVGYRHGDPLAYDAEESRFVSPAKVMAWAQQVRRRLGADANMYAYMNSSTTRAYNWSAVAASGVKLWVANYGRNDGAYHGSPSMAYWDQWHIHQYTSVGRRPGYNGNLDMNVARQGAWGDGATTTTVPVSNPAASTVPRGMYLGYSVVQTQRLLAAHGYQLALDDYYGPGTRAAVSDYQSTHGLHVDGYAGPATQASLSGKATATTRTYTVARGDTLSRIGAKTGVPWTTIASLNGIRAPYVIYTGQTLKLAGSSTVASSNRRYTIRRGDTLSSIARRLGTTTSRLVALNGISNPNRIYTGHTINY
ncbi:LysM peptidoglycan-binding domain-containing protein [Bifidobacterium crudilactis]|jgi:LysM repeat protein/GH25 family lysozyme M1 (1,4-beta-N-acetylmuramidase)|uniref:LysM peptidoglycan-binding domain-containing protein n=1 Tax=Bifidobacterium crudilactis TaxID=327277 RepID=UPI002357EA58|nr:LysM peptidoglycan-binding domain-containing protein [Bifidobacterium crudilactis]MCI2149568.1 LysM peptidoglycan-binding domain-containing protein [Bifidobacterium crudilactis]MCI2158576.1 LysM peptidoglycan-binding domain-containing protein [Bifidobacterium crudilactis]